MKVLLRVTRIGALVYLGLLMFLGACQNKLLYFPSRGSQAALLEEARMEGLQPWKDASGAVIGWHTAKRAAARRIVVFHGNAGYALHRSYYTEALGRLGWDVYLFEYPGYGACEGSPGRSSFMA